MASISIKNVGPITNTGSIELGRFNVFIGKQSTGKSTIMKILCFCKWIEKKVVMGDDDNVIYNYTHYSRFLKELMQFHRLNTNFFNAKSEIHYSGESVTIDLVGNKNVKINPTSNFDGNRHNTKLCFIPSERNLVSAIKNIDRTYKSNDFDVLFNHISEWGEVKRNFNEEHPIDLTVIDNTEYYYDLKSEKDFIKIEGGRKKIDPFYASSGVQSVLPIVVMTDYLTSQVFEKGALLTTFLFRRFVNKWIKNNKHNIVDSYDDILNEFSKTYGYKNTQLFIEEPEQNLFPESQQALINFIALSINNATQKTQRDSSVSMTTHSPYVITALNVLIKAHEAAKIDEEKTSEIIPKKSWIPIDDIKAYYICENGTLADIVDREIGMIGGVELDKASEIVEDKLSLLNDIVYGNE